jgi:hypothetical protein
LVAIAFFNILYAIGCSYLYSSNIISPQKANKSKTIKEQSAGNPNTAIRLTVIILIGIIKPSGETIMLYPYNKKAAITNFFTKLNIFVNIIITI